MEGGKLTDSEPAAQAGMLEADMAQKSKKVDDAGKGDNVVYVGTGLGCLASVLEKPTQGGGRGTNRKDKRQFTISLSIETAGWSGRVV